MSSWENLDFRNQRENGRKSFDAAANNLKSIWKKVQNLISLHQSCFHRKKQAAFCWIARIATRQYTKYIFFVLFSLFLEHNLFYHVNCVAKWLTMNNQFQAPCEWLNVTYISRHAFIWPQCTKAVCPGFANEYDKQAFCLEILSP